MFYFMNDYKTLYKKVLKEYQAFSKCARLHVAALLVENGRILCCGYNGTPTGQCNCNELFCDNINNGYQQYMLRNDKTKPWKTVTEQIWREKHHEYSLENELHAEMNCIASACKSHIPVQNCSMVISLAPCENCAKLIFASGIKHVMYVDEYDRGSKGINFLRKNNVVVEKI